MSKRLLETRSVLFLMLLVSDAVFATRLLAADDLQAFLGAHCLECHGADHPEGGLSLTLLPKEYQQPEVFARWINVLDRVAAGEMPPRSEPRPAPAETQKALAQLTTSLRMADLAQQQRTGRGTVRRLNRVEYEQTLRDLLALPGLQFKEMLPEDGQKYGFDKVAEGLDISHIQMSKYLQVADKALRQAIVRGVKAPETKTWREPAAKQDTGRAAIAIHCGVPLVGQNLAPGLTTHVAGNPRDDYGNTYRAGNFQGEAESVALLTGVIGAHQPEGLQIDHFRPTVGGWYQVKFSVWGLKWERTKAVPAKRGLVRQFTTFGPPYFQDDAGHWNFTKLAAEVIEPRWKENTEFYGEGEANHIVRASLHGKPLGYFNAPSLKPTTHELKVWLNPADRISFHAMTLPASGASNSGVSNGVYDYEGPAIAFDWFEVTGPLVEQWPPASQRRLFGETPLESFARPAAPNLPAVKAGQTRAIDIADWQGAGQNIDRTRYLNIMGASKTSVNCTVPGEYELAVTAYQSAAGDEPAKMQLWMENHKLHTEPIAVEALLASPKTYRMKFSVDSPGPVELSIEFLNDYFDDKNPDPARRDRNLWMPKVEVIAPQAAEVGPAGDKASSPLFVTPDVTALLTSFAARAFRRPIEPAEMRPYLKIVEDQLKAGKGYEEALLAGYQALLCAPDFLFVGLEPSQYALASRLSYFLWNSQPDDELLSLAKSGELAQVKVLQSQAERMLADPKSDRFVEHFLDEWLELKKIDFTTPDPQLYPEFDPWLRDSMLTEVRTYFRHLLTADLSVSHLVASDFILINQRLAEQYGIRGIEGAQFRSVPVTPEQKRGGFLTQAAVLKVTANGTATSPVLRGVWINERLLGVPRQPPPPNIPAVEPDATGAVTIRQMIEKHRADQACATCHAKIDPPGMALESFDVIGGLRNRYRLSGEPGKIQKDGVTVEEPFVEIVSGAAHRNRVKLRLGSEVDSSGELADGRKFESVAGLQKLLLDNSDQLARNFVQKLMIYATGDGIHFSDRAEIEEIVAQGRAQKHGLKSLLQGVVASRIFREASLAPSTATKP